MTDVNCLVSKLPVVVADIDDNGTNFGFQFVIFVSRKFGYLLSFFSLAFRSLLLVSFTLKISPLKVRDDIFLLLTVLSFPSG